MLMRLPEKEQQSFWYSMDRFRRMWRLIQLKLYLVIFSTVKDFVSTVYSSNYWISFCEDMYVK